LKKSEKLRLGENPREDGAFGVVDDDLEAGGEAGFEGDGEREDREAAEGGGGGEGEEAAALGSVHSALVRAERCTAGRIRKSKVRK